MATNFIRVTSHAEFAEAVNGILDKYALELGGRLPEVIEATAKDCARDVREYAEQAVNESTGDALKGKKYKKSWSCKMENKASVYKSYARVYSKAPYYRLAHLLEYGHAKRNGGRTGAYPHIAKASDVTECRLMSRIREALEDAK